MGDWVGWAAGCWYYSAMNHLPGFLVIDHKYRLIYTHTYPTVPVQYRSASNLPLLRLPKSTMGPISIPFLYITVHPSTPTSNPFLSIIVHPASPPSIPFLYITVQPPSPSSISFLYITVHPAASPTSIPFQSSTFQSTQLD